MDIIQKNKLANIYAKEAEKHKIGSPFRIGEYIKYRLKGYSEKKSLEKVKKNPQNNQD